jgi:hypothetical protein
MGIMRARFAAIFMTALMWSACGGDRQPAAAGPTAPTPPSVTTPGPSSPTPPPSIVSGIVLDFQTAKPIPGAVVAFAIDAGPGGGPLGATETAVADANGRYSLTEPPARANGAGYRFFVNDKHVGTGYPRSTNYRADLAVDKGLCVTRYGMVLDSTTYLPIAGATALNLSNRVMATTGQDGWYQIDWGCGVGYVGFNTTWHIMSHPNYTSKNFATGRGIIGLYREDVILTPR